MTTRRISERDLILPALFCIDRAEEISTTDLSTELRTLLNPRGEDLEILSGRSDDKFSQKVRNLSSHRTLGQPGFVTYESRGRQGYWRLTSNGKAFLEANKPLIEYLLDQRFDYDLQQDALAQVVVPVQEDSQQLNLFDESIIEADSFILEGKEQVVKQRTYERSRRLRDAAILHYSISGQISCHVCGFNFGQVHGSLGEGFIEIHHRKPIFSYGNDDIEKTLNEALQNVVPLCSNCHRMIHRKRGEMLTVAQLKEIFNRAK